jgi:hypothetical protein
MYVFFLNLREIINLYVFSFGSLQTYYILSEDPDSYPPAIDAYLNKIAPKIGAVVNWEITSDTVYSNFANTGKSIIFQPFIGGFYPL